MTRLVNRNIINAESNAPDDSIWEPKPLSIREFL